MRTNKVQNKIDEIKKLEDKIQRKDLKYKSNKCIYGFQQYETIRSFVDSIYTHKFIIDKAEVDQSNLLDNIVEFNNKSRPKTRR